MAEVFSENDRTAKELLFARCLQGWKLAVKALQDNYLQKAKLLFARGLQNPGLAEQQLAREPSCCLQGRGEGPTTKPLQGRTLSPKPSCCLQDGRSVAAGPVAVVRIDCAERNRVYERDSA
jgi:hypothetical protein